MPTEIVPPPWHEFPEIPRGSIGWRIGEGEDYLYAWRDWFDTLSEQGIASYISSFPEKPGWEGFYEFEIKQRQPRRADQPPARTFARVLTNVCMLAHRYKRVGNDKSPVELLRESGYLALPSAATEQRILRYLQANKWLIESWQLWSLDKRTSAGWYFECSSSGAEVGYFAAGAGRRNVRKFSSCVEACAAFIVSEAQHLARLASGEYEAASD